MVGSRVYVGGLPFGVRQRDIEKFFKGFGKTRDILIKNGYGFVEFDDYRDADDAVYELNGKELLGERVVVEAARGIDRRRDSGRDDWRRPARYGDKVSVERARGTPRGADMWRDYGRYGAPPPRRPRSRDKYDSRAPIKRTEASGGTDSTSNCLEKKYGPPTRTEFRLIVENLSSRISWQDLKDFMRQAGEVTYADAHKQRKNEGVVEFATHSDLRNALDKLDGTELNGRRIRLVEDRRRGGGRHSRSSSSRSRSRSRRRSRSRSRSRSRRSSRSRSRSNSKTRPKSKSPAPKSRSRSKQRSASPASRSRSRSRSKSANSRASARNSRERSRSASKEKSKSKSRSPTPNDHKDNGAGSDHNESTED